MFEVLADGVPWQDADGCDTFTEREAIDLAVRVARLGYHVTVGRVSLLVD
jgi:hypothetical protein